VPVPGVRVGVRTRRRSGAHPRVARSSDGVAACHHRRVDDFDPDELDRIGERLSQAWVQQRLLHPEFEADRAALLAFRTSGQTALSAASDALEEAAEALGIEEFEVSQRIKQRGTILHKLQRMRDLGRPLALSEMIDVIGCRIVVATPAEASRVAELIRARSPLEVVAAIDYATRPKRTGYRAIHLRARSQGRLVEVQVRTRRQHEWAQRSEDLQLGVAAVLRDGGGPEAIQRYLRALGDVLAVRDAGREPSPRLLDRLERAERELGEYHEPHGDD